MKYKKSMIILVLAILLVFIASASASDVNDTSLTSEDANQIELSTNNEIIEDNLNANEQNTQLQSNYDETVSVENELNILSENEGTFTDLKNEIGDGGNITLTKTHYNYNPVKDEGTKTIQIKTSGVIDGNGAVIDMEGSTIQAFTIAPSGVTIKNLTIKNVNYNWTEGGAIYFERDGTVSNCNFINNKLTVEKGYAGAVYFQEKGNVVNCNFINNTADYGGAVYFKNDGIVTNSNFTDNHARRGAALNFEKAGNVTNSNFTNNTVTGLECRGGAIMFSMYAVLSASSCMAYATNCNFVGNSAEGKGGAIWAIFGNVTNCNFVNNKVNGSESGGAIYIDAGNVTNCNFTGNTANSGGAIQLTYVSNTPRQVINCNFINNSATSFGGGVCFNGSYIIINCNFINNKVTGSDSMGGAIYTGSMGSGNVENCNFTNNSAVKGGAVYFYMDGAVRNCNFTDNYANYGGAAHFTKAEVTNSNFIGNNATRGSAIYFSSTISSIPNTISNSCFLKNRANVEELQVTKNDNTITIIFTGNDNLLNAIYAEMDVNFTNVTYWGANGIANTGSSTTIPSRSNREAGQNITVGVVVNDKLVLNEVKVTNENGMIILPIINGENYYIRVLHEADSYYTEAEKTISNMAFIVNVTSQETHNRTVNITAKSNIFGEAMDGKLLFILPNTDPITANYASNGTWWALHTFDKYDVYQVNATYEGLDNVIVKNNTISISKTPTNINIVNETVNLFVSDSVGTGATLNPADAGNLTFTSNNESVAKVVDGKIIAVSEGTAVITVSFAGNYDYIAAEDKTITVKVIKYDSKVIISPITDVVYPNKVTIKYSIENRTNVTVSIDGVSSDKILITNDTITVIGLDVGTYTITILNNESDLYYKSNDTKSFIVNKDTTNIAAVDVSTIYNINKYLVVALKDSNGQVLSGFKVTVDINGVKTYTTDKNGQVKVSTIGLVPKTYNVKITFNGNTNYQKSSKSIKITVKKATPKITAKKKTYNVKTKTKKYTVVLKDNTGKAIKKAKVVLKVKGKTYKATTNNKGKATFKIKKLNKKGTFKATITYKGNKYYNKVTKKVKIKAR